MSDRVTFTVDWSVTRQYWSAMFACEGLAGRPGLRFLEVGAFEGAASLWLLENVLTHPTSTLTVVDTFEGSPEHGPMQVDVDGLEARFRANLAGYESQLEVHVGRSSDELGELGAQHRTRLVAGMVTGFDFAYLDGSHHARDVLEDAVLTWPLLKLGGLLVFDDLAWQGPSQLESPALGIEAFVACYQAEALPCYVREAAGAQLVLRKRDPIADARLGIR